MQIRRQVGTAVVAVAMLIGSAVSAQAAPREPEVDIPAGVVVTDELQEYLDTLSAAEREEFVTTMLPVERVQVVQDQVPLDDAARESARLARVTGETIAPLATGCWAGRVNDKYKAAAGNTVFTFYHVGQWCASGSTVTSASVADAGGETSTPGWRYEGVINKSAGVVSSQGRSYSQVKFVLGAGGWDIQTATPCTRVKGAAAGTYTWDTTCGIY
jgi:hypothetical protein